MKKLAKIAIASDLHIMSSQLLIERGAAFERVLESDRKLLVESEAIVDQLFEQLLEEQPQLLLIPGDLTKDGEVLSHQLLVSKLDALREAGIASLVIPGNHDLNNPQARYYLGDEHKPAEYMTPEAFSQMYAHYGYAGPTLVERGPRLCYLSEPIEGLWVIGIDSCFYENNIEDDYPFTGGEIKEETLEWVEEVARRGKEEGKTILAMMHHGILEHFPLQTIVAKEYLVKRWIKVATRFANAGVRVVFTGHFHAQDVVALRFPGGFLYDVQTGSTVTYPCPYRIIEVYPDRLEIESHLVKIQDERTDDMTLQEYAYKHLEEGLPQMADYLIGYVQKFYPGKLDDSVANVIRELLPHFTPLIMDIYTGHLAGDEVGLKYNPNKEDRKTNPYSGDLLNELRQLALNMTPQYAPYFTLVEGALHSTILEDNNLTIPLN